jgi:hypothetical protein
LQRAQAALAVELSRADAAVGIRDPLVAHSFQEVLVRRARMAGLGHPEAIASPLRPAIPRVAVLGLLATIVLCGLIWFAISSMHGA